MLKILSRFIKPNESMSSVDVRYKTAMAAGNRHLAEGATESAVRSYQLAVELSPDEDDAFVRLGYALKESGALGLATEAFNSALERNETNAEAYYFLGCIALSTKEYDVAAERLQAALRLDPHFEQAYSDATFCLFRLGRSNDALTLLSQGMNVLPKRPHLLFAKGNLLAETSRYREAVQAYQDVLAIAPEFVEALANMGNCERHLGQTQLALQHINAALAHRPGNAAWWSNRLFTLQYSGSMDQATLFGEHKRFAEMFEAPLRKDASVSVEENGRKTGTRLRVGYVSGDFRQHSLAYFFEPVLQLHNRDRVEIYCYYTYPASDKITQRLRSVSEHWRDCADLSDEDMVEQIKRDRIDILVDLSGHTGHNRLLVFARKPAPVQMTWLGYQATTGLQSIDYRITDAGIDPPGETDRYFSEKLLRLSSGAVFQPDPRSPPVNELPSISSGTFTFACLNNPAKITNEFFATAATILHGTSNTRLLMGNVNAANAAELLNHFAHHGIPSDRLILIDQLSLPDYLSLHSAIDLALDTFPYNGGTTTMHSLWMGVPVLALEGDAAISRVGAQVMRGLGLGYFACGTLTEYADRAISLASRRKFLQGTRSGLRSRMKNSMVDQARAFTIELESAYFKAADGREK